MNNLFNRSADVADAKWKRRAQKPAAQVDLELPSWTQHTGFPLFNNLPPEIRRKIWHLFIPRRPPQFVEIVPKHPDWPFSHDPLLCSRKCKEHRRPPGHSPFPPPLQVCRESRAEFLNIYTPFSCATFTSASVNWKTDSLRPMQCQHRCHYFNPAWDLNGNIFARLATNPDAVASIVSLTLCVCQRDVASFLASNFHNAQNLFRKYKNLQELIFAREGTQELLEEEHRSEVDLRLSDIDRSPSHMVNDMQQARWLQELLDRAAISSGGRWKSPRVRCVMVIKGEVVWERAYNSKVRDENPSLRRGQ